MIIHKMIYIEIMIETLSKLKEELSWKFNKFSFVTLCIKIRKRKLIKKWNFYKCYKYIYNKDKTNSWIRTFSGL